MVSIGSKEPTYPMGTVHEPDAPLLSADDLVEDLAAMRTYLQHQRATAGEHEINLRIPLWVLDAIKQVDLSALREIADLTEQQLALHKTKNQVELRVPQNR